MSFNNKIYIPTSSEQITKAVPGISVWLYRDLARLTHLPALPIALLYETAPGFGHWTALLTREGGRLIEHFDSYGLRPDAELKWVPEAYRDAFSATAPHLVRLLYDTGLPIDYSEFRLQGRGDIATCGRWVVARARNAILTAAQFAQGVRDLAKSRGETPDESAVALTEFSMGDDDDGVLV